MRQIKVSVKPQEDRLDKFIPKKIKNLTRSQAKKLINQSNILVNKSQTSPDYKVKKGDVISVEIPPPKPLEIRGESIPLNIIYEDDSILVVDKEEGMVVHPTLDHPSGTLVNALINHLKKLPDLGKNLRPGIVHRLDRGTSGVMVVGKQGEAVERLKSQFKSRSVKKKYVLLVGKKLEPPVGTVEKPIDRHPIYRQRFTISEEGRKATTHYKVTEYFGDKFTLVEAEPKTGRTHQLRVHLASIGYPIVGDKLYGGRPAPRLFLHASSLEFDHPKTGKKMKFESPLPRKLVEILVKIKESMK